MRTRASQRREVDLFNFSFLDILACVIGLLIFVLTIVVVSGGGAANTLTASQLSGAEHELQTARTESQMSANRRQRDEQLLTERSRDLADPEYAANLVRDQIKSLDAERSELDAAFNSARARFASLASTLDLLNQSPNVDPSTGEVQAEIRNLDQRTATIAAQTQAASEKEKANISHVHYYVPHMREVARRTLWVEISGDRLWCVGSSDYDRDVIDEDSSRFTRHPVRGTLVAQMAKSDNAAPMEISVADPENTVIEVALRPDGYAAFRVLRDWAWNKGYSVNWVPMNENSIVLTHTTHVFEQ